MDRYNKLYIILALSTLVKAISVFIFHEKALSDEWLVLFNNFEKYKIYSYYFLEGKQLPSSYMPPVYLFFLYLNKLLSLNLFNFLYLVYFSQIVLSILSVFLFYQICRNFFDEIISLIGTLIFALFPLLIITTALISSASIQIFFYLLFIYFSLHFIDNKKVNIFVYALVCAICLLLRGEFLVIFLLSLIFFIFFLKKKLKDLIILSIITLLFISPYLLRNYLNTEKIYIVNVSGYALWKGNNHLANVEGYHNSLHPNERNNWPQQNIFYELYKNLDNLQINKKYELARDRVFFNEAKKNILNDKKKYFNLYLKKIMSFYFIDLNSTINNYYNFFHIAPILFISILSLPGIFIAALQKKKVKLLYIFMLMTSLIFLISLFFILPRYKISILSFQIIFSLFTVDYLIKKINKLIK
jgi:4-amino-4-deoxy-L-arabinose transferase-like glycosyltransferase